MKNDSEGNRQRKAPLSSLARRLSFVGGDFHGLSLISPAMLCQRKQETTLAYPSAMVIGNASLLKGLKNSLSIVVTYIPISNAQM